MLQHYQNQACPEAAALMQDEAITYSVLINILQGECTDIFTDHEGVVICYSFPPYPVWVWCRDVENAQYVDSIARCLKTAFPLEKGYTYNLSYELLERLKETDECFRDTVMKMRLLSYRLDEIHDVKSCDGFMSLVREDEIPDLIGVRHDMVMEMEGFDLSAERCEASLRFMVEGRCLFAWRDDAGKIAALTGRGDQGKYSKITSVYTLPQHRRKGYAINLVHGVTETMLSDGLIPILYTNADYVASNACYRKIGYRQVGSLCNVHLEAGEA